MASFGAGSAAAPAFDGERLILVGTYGQDLGFVQGQGAGVYAFRLDGAGEFAPAMFQNRPLLPSSAVGLNPSYLCASPAFKHVVYVTDEARAGPAGGRRDRPRVDLDAAGGSPTATALGAPLACGATSTCHDTGHAHMVLLSKDESAVLCPDLGADAVYRVDAAAGAAELCCVLAAGDGQRPPAWHPTLDVLYVLCELSSVLRAFRVDGSGRALGDGAPFSSARAAADPCYPAGGGPASRPPTRAPGRGIVNKGKDLDRPSIAEETKNHVADSFHVIKKHGYLEKLSRGAMAGYQKRYFVLSAPTSSTTKTDQRKELLAAVDVRPVLLEVGSDARA
ncbi:hypothetical protein SO694_00043166 [Aureococcus anophagefferens]|uniref:Uncharacterized protein n=1 Tax=Aureococcus anophagefferens TaxID=44056 RepID=A0ABR1G7M3_AURAN